MFKLKKLKRKLYNFRITEEEMDMVIFLRKSGVDLPGSLRKYIKKIYNSIKNKDMDDNIYKL